MYSMCVHHYSMASDVRKRDFSGASSPWFLISVGRHPELLISMIFWNLRQVQKLGGTRIMQSMNDELQLTFGFSPLSTPTPAPAVPIQPLNATDANITNILSALATDQQITRQMLQALASERENQPQQWSPWLLAWLLAAATYIVARMLKLGLVVFLKPLRRVEETLFGNHLVEQSLEQDEK